MSDKFDRYGRLDDDSEPPKWFKPAVTLGGLLCAFVAALTMRSCAPGEQELTTSPESLYNEETHLER